MRAFTWLSLIPAFLVATVASADTYTMIDVGAGTEASSRGDGLNVLLQVGGKFGGASEAGVSFFIAHFDATAAISDEGMPMGDFNFAILGIDDEERIGGAELIPMHGSRDVRIGNEGMIQVHLIGVFYDGARSEQFKELSRAGLAGYIKYAVAGVGGRVAQLAGHEGTYSGFDLGRGRFEAGLGAAVSSGLTLRMGLGGEASFSVGSNRDRDGTAILADASAYAEITADIRDAVTIFVRGGAGVLENTGKGYATGSQLQILGGAQYRFR